MTSTDPKQKRFTAVVGMPKFLLPWIDRFYEPAEIDLALALGKRPATVSEIAKHFRGAKNRKTSIEVKAMLERGYKRGTLNRQADNRYEPAEFHARYEIWALFEGWQDIPEEIRRRLNKWEMAAYTKKHRRDVTAVRKSKRDPASVCPEYVLLNEAEALLDKPEKQIVFYRDLCRGCGVCATGCPEDAIEMIPLNDNRSLWDKISG
jgi:Pyruvate/2-oxoacid:ferredoxin oxidoreductase delta subunit